MSSFSKTLTIFLFFFARETKVDLSGHASRQEGKIAELSMQIGQQTLLSPYIYKTLG